MALASQGLGEAIKAVYEPELPNSEETYASIDGLDLMWVHTEAIYGAGVAHLSPGWLSAAGMAAL